MTSHHLVIQTEHLSPAAAQWLGERCRLVRCDVDDARFAALLAEADALVVRTYTLVDAALLAGAPRLKVIGRAGVGLDNIDLHACRARGVQVVYTPDANSQAVAEYVCALLLDVLRPRVALEHAVGKTQWNQLREQYVGTRQIRELTFGILGLGRVGRRVAAIARAVGCEVLYNDLLEIAQAQRCGAQPVDLHALFTRCDIISIHIDSRPANRRFVSKQLIGLMKSDAIFINTSRGFVVDDLALADWLRTNASATALLDVHEPEPFPADYPLLGLANARLYPHLASRTNTAMNNMSWVVKDVLAVLENRQPEFPAPQ